jgi:hypothetical protein
MITANARGGSRRVPPSGSRFRQVVEELTTLFGRTMSSDFDPGVDTPVRAKKTRQNKRVKTKV